MFEDVIMEYLYENKFNGDFVDDANYITGKSKENLAKDLAEIAEKEMAEIKGEIFAKTAILEDLHERNIELEKQLADVKYLDRDKLDRFLRLKFGYRYQHKTIMDRDIKEAVNAICKLAIREVGNGKDHTGRG